MSVPSHLRRREPQLGTLTSVYCVFGCFQAAMVARTAGSARWPARRSRSGSRSFSIPPPSRRSAAVGQSHGSVPGITQQLVAELPHAPLACLRQQIMPQAVDAFKSVPSLSLRVGSRSAGRRDPFRAIGRWDRIFPGRSRTDRCADGRRRTRPRARAFRPVAARSGRRCSLSSSGSRGTLGGGLGNFSPSSVSTNQLPRSTGLVRDAADCLVCTLPSAECRRDRTSSRRHSPPLRATTPGMP